MKNIISKRLAMLLVFCLVVCGLPLNAAAVDASGTCGDKITWTLDSAGTLTISGTGKMNEYGYYLSSAVAPWYELHDKIKTVNIREGVTSVGFGAFWGCDNLTSAVIPDSVVSVGRRAFSDCSALTSITMPAIIEFDARFDGCNNINFVKLTGTGAIPEGHWSTTFSYRDTPWYIGSEAGNRVVVEIENGVTGIGRDAFRECKNLTIAIPSSVINIAGTAFYDCDTLTIYYSGTKELWEQINTGTWGNDYQLNANIYCNSTNSAPTPAPTAEATIAIANGQCGHNVYWKLDRNGTLTISGTGPMKDYALWDNTDAPWYYMQEQVRHLEIEYGVTHIGNTAFHSCRKLASVTISNSVTSIGVDAFNYSGLTKVTIPNSITVIGDGAFRNCDSLISINVEPTHTKYCSIDGVLFSKDKTRLISYPAGKRGAYSIPNHINTIGTLAFAGCSNLSVITIPSSVREIEQFAFASCNLTDVYYDGNETQWQKIAIDNTGNWNSFLLDATIHYSDVGEATPKITTETLQSIPNGVVDVPYQAIIETTLGENITKTHELLIESGEFPQGLLLETNGELHGIPSQSGEYEFTIALKKINKQDILDKRSYKVIIKESTPENVAEVNTSTQGYRLLYPLPETIDFDEVESGTEFTFRSEGPLNQLDAVYIDGDELTRGVDYTATEGSCVIALNDMGYGGRTAGRHVISATFKQPSTQGNFTLKKTAQAVSFVNPKPRPIPKYSIKLDCSAGGAAVVSNKSVEAGKIVTITAKPSYGWEINQVTAGSAKVTRKDDKYTFMMPASAVTAKVSFKRRGAAEGTNMPFFDVRTVDWFYEPVKAIYEAGLMKGTARNAFSPNHPALREMIATILYRHAGTPSVEGSCPFTDVKAGSYYEKAVIWAKQNRVIDGTTSTKFSPSGKITREQLVTMLYRYAGRPEGRGALSKFTDIDKMSAWAEAAMSWAIGNGIVTGKGNNRLDPKGNATRAEIATILQRFLELCESVEIELSTQRLQMSVGDVQTIQLLISKLGYIKTDWSKSEGNIIDIIPNGMSCKIEALNPGRATVYAKVYDRIAQCAIEVDDLVPPDDGTDEPIPPDDLEPDLPTVSVNNQIMSTSEETRTLSVMIPHTTDISLSWIPWDGCTGQIIPKEQADGLTLPNIELPCEDINLDEIATLVESNAHSKTYQIEFEIILSELSSLIYTLNITVLN